ncbi:hypothetical protein PV10_07294 [Exophiala mesophila]|uniref:Plant heme peroxidase family profile domain-containing protein n=1 Tax=Exophiala mesophila TaxID=212818 RepID=A0A0D1WLR7_EXOME|nr:uncharacterized protein PV10_07294 [Exophiala mesophila]KIV89940.1 hypothetical protein PV10_07294 [Exophiala mesophila]
MQAYAELLPPQGVTAALAVAFTSQDASNLLVARTSLLQVFSQKQVSGGQDAKLVLIAEYNLPGTITQLGRLKLQTSRSGGDAVLVALRDAKLSLIEWDPTLHSITTLSIHYYEQDTLQTAPWQIDLGHCVSHLTVDPSSRCAAFNFGVNNLAIVPFHQTSDDLAMDDDYDDTHDGEELAPKDEQAPKSHNGTNIDTPYYPSFVLPTTALDPGLLHPIDLAFLHEYRDPTIGILYSSAARSSNMVAERKDVTIYAVYALDLEQKASTALQSVQKLPNDVQKVIPLPLPVGGALLVGGNELIHVDQGGKSSAIAVNEFARDASAFSMTDQSDLRLKLEGCQIEHLGNPSGDMLIFLQTGEIALLSFRMDGRSLSSMNIRRIDDDYASTLSLGPASCTANIGQGNLFIGSEESDSIVLATSKKASQLKRTLSRAHTQGNGTENDVDDEDDVDSEDEDDLYADPVDRVNGAAPGDVAVSGGPQFRVLDQLCSIAPINDTTFGLLGKRKRSEEDDSTSEDLTQARKRLVASYGRGRAGGVAFICKELDLDISKKLSFPQTTKVWSFSSHSKTKARVAGGPLPTDDLMIVSQSPSNAQGNNAEGKSSLLQSVDGEYQPRPGSEFDGSAGATIFVGKLDMTNHTVQVLSSEVRVYDAEFGLSQIYPIVDEDERQVSKAVKVSFADPYLAIVKEDGAMSLLKADKAGELDEIELPEDLAVQSLLAAILYQDESDFFQSSRFYPDASESGPVLAILTTEGNFQLLSLPNLNFQIFQCASLSFFPTYLMQDLQIPKHWRNKDYLSEMTLADIGDATCRQPYLIARNTVGDVILYQPFAVPDVVGSYKFKKVGTWTVPYAEGQGDSEKPLSRPSMNSLGNPTGFSWVFVPGSTPSAILKHASTAPHMYNLGSERINAVSNISDGPSDTGFVFVGENGSVCFAQIPPTTLVGLSDWAIQRVPLQEDISFISYFERTHSYILATNAPTEFQLPQDDEWHQEWQKETTTFLPTMLQSSLKLMSPATHSIISRYTFDTSERILCVKCLNLEISEETHERKDLIVVGTAVVKGENVTTRGNLYIFDVVDVVPDPDIPESDLKLKLITQEDVRGAVSAISDVGAQGFVLAAQGQKCMVRGLKEDMSVLPVAFLDMRYYVSVAKELRGTGLCILGDAFSGLWLVGYSEEPYKLQILSRDFENPEVMTADFLPDGRQLYIISVDNDGQLRVLQYDPEDPKTERGARLLIRSTFNTGDCPTAMTLLPPPTPASTKTRRNRARRGSNASIASSASSSSSSSSMSLDATSPTNPTSSSSSPSSRHRILLTTQSGSMSLLTPVPESTYRRLSNLQNILLTSLDFHPCSLNPRAYRQIETDGVGGRGIIDGNLVRRWWETSTQQRVNSADKAGGSVWEIRGDLETIGTADLDW